jgi:hypothetical protein
MPVNANNTTVLYDNFALAAYLKSAAPNVSVAMLDATTLADSSLQYLPGLRTNQFSLSGLFDSASGAGTLLDDITSRLGSSTAVAATISPAGFATGNPAWLLPALTVDYQVSSTVADLVPFTLNLGAAAPAGSGLCLTALAAQTATGNGASQDNGAGTSNGAVCHLHITAVSGTTPSMTAIVQHSTNNSTWTTLGSFSAATAVGSQTLQVSGTVNRYVRASFTISGTNPSFTTLVAVSRF